MSTYGLNDPNSPNYVADLEGRLAAWRKMAKPRYRWECRDCRKQGRWTRDYAVASNLAFQHNKTKHVLDGRPARIAEELAV